MNWELDPLIFDDPHLKHLSYYSLRRCEESFKEKGGILNVLKINGQHLKGKVSLRRGDSLYPVCSGAHCRSQALFCLLRKWISHQITLFFPHASRWGYDPYNEKIPQIKEVPSGDEFELTFGHPRIERFGFAYFEKCLQEGSIKNERFLSFAKGYYDHHYYAPKNVCARRVYIAFAHPVHAVLKRLVETNSDLSQVMLVAIPLEDEITHPPSYSSFKSGSKEAYQAFLHKLSPIFEILEY